MLGTALVFNKYYLMAERLDRIDVGQAVGEDERSFCNCQTKRTFLYLLKNKLSQLNEYAVPD